MSSPADVSHDVPLAMMRDQRVRSVAWRDLSELATRQVY
jgi:hypothetical protein